MTKKPNKRQQVRLDELVEYVRDNTLSPGETVTVHIGLGGFERRLVRLAIRLGLVDWTWMDQHVIGLRLGRVSR